MEILDTIEQSETPADAFIRAYFRSRRYAGSKDRRAVAEKVYSVIRSRARLDWWIAGAAGDLAPGARSRVLASLLLIDGHGLDALEVLFSGQGHGPQALEPSEKDLAANLTGKSLFHQAMPEAVLHEVPAWLSDRLKRQWGENFAAEMAALNTAAQVDVRVNLGRVSRQQARKALGRDGVKSDYTPLSPAGLRLHQHTGLAATRAFAKGLIEVQDEGSQLIALLCQARPEMTVIDYCAGGGGKTLALADIMGLQGNLAAPGRLIACDISGKRLGRMDERLKRAGAEAVERVVLAAKEIPGELQNSADRVLVDAPCSGTGAWRRHPDARWRLSPERLDDYIALQRTILSEAAKLVKPGGRLIYATCSLLDQENEDQIAWLLAQNSELSPLPMGQIWTDATGTAAPPGTARTQSLTLSPAATGTDGFYCAILGKSCE